MVWADRIGIGVGALTILGSLIFFSLDTTAEQQKKQSDEYTFAVAECKRLASDTTPKDLVDRVLGPKCPPNEPNPIAVTKLGGLVGTIFGYFVLPLWLVLRIIDFMFGGPARRRGARTSNNFVAR